MNKETIEGGNKLIAEFMGGVLHKKLSSDHSFKIAPKQIPFEPKDFLVLGELKYHSSWDWLMPVVEKIGKLYDPYKYKAYETKEDVWEIVDLTLMNHINEVWDSVVKFIEWYNSQSKTKP